MDWLAMTPAVIVAVAILVAPGAGLGAAIGLRGAAILIAAAPLTLSLVGIAAIVAGLFERPWSPLAFAVATAAAVVAALLIWLICGRPTMRIVRLSTVSLITGMAFASALMVTTIITFFPRPELLAQTFDNVFHLNAIRYAMDTGNASSFAIAGLTSGSQQPGFYPAGWHAFIALVVEVIEPISPGFTIPMAVSAGTIAVVLFAWSLGCLVVSQVVAGPSLAATVLTSATIGSTYLFPWLFVRWGSLYPNLLGNSALPSLLALLVLLTRPSGEEQAPRRGIPAAESALDRRPRARAAGRSVPQLSGRHPAALTVAVIVLALPGVGLAHPNSAFALVLAALVVLWAQWARRLRLVGLWSVAASLLTFAALAAASFGFAEAWIRLAPAQPQAPPPPSGWPTVLSNLLVGAGNERIPAAPALTVLMAVGIVGVVRLRMFVPAAWAIVATAIYVIATGGPTAELALAAGGLFYSDTLRILVFVFVMSVPLLAAGIGALVDAIDWLTSRVRFDRTLAAMLTLLLAAAIAVPTQLQSLQPAITAASAKYVVPSDNAQYLSVDELALISQLGSIVPAGERIVADPGNGSGFIYALTGVKLVFPHMFVTDTAATAQLRNSMFDAKQLSATCAAVAELNAHYFYYTERWHSRLFSGPAYFPGLARPKQPMLKLVARVGGASIYRFSACDG